MKFLKLVSHRHAQPKNIRPKRMPKMLGAEACIVNTTGGSGANMMAKIRVSSVIE
jgi:hypothetical protein